MGGTFEKEEEIKKTFFGTFLRNRPTDSQTLSQTHRRKASLTELHVAAKNNWRYEHKYIHISFINICYVACQSKTIKTQIIFSMKKGGTSLLSA